MTTPVQDKTRATVLKLVQTSLAYLLLLRLGLETLGMRRKLQALERWNPHHLELLHTWQPSSDSQNLCLRCIHRRSQDQIPSE